MSFLRQLSRSQWTQRVSGLCAAHYLRFVWHAIVLDNWGRTPINLRFGRSAPAAGAPIYVPRDADEDMLELARRALEVALNAATGRAYEPVDRPAGDRIRG